MVRAKSWFVFFITLLIAIAAAVTIALGGFLFAMLLFGV